MAQKPNKTLENLRKHYAKMVKDRGEGTEIQQADIQLFKMGLELVKVEKLVEGSVHGSAFEQENPGEDPLDDLGVSPIRSQDSAPEEDSEEDE